MTRFVVGSVFHLIIQTVHLVFHICAQKWTPTYVLCFKNCFTLPFRILHRLHSLPPLFVAYGFRVRILHQNQLAAKGLAARLGRQIQVAPKVHGALGGKVSGPQLMTTKPIYSTVIWVGEVYQICIVKGSLRNWCSCVNGLHIHLINIISGFFSNN